MPSKNNRQDLPQGPGRRGPAPPPVTARHRAGGEPDQHDTDRRPGGNPTSMTATATQARERHCRAAELYTSEDATRPWPDGEVVIASSTEGGATRYVLALPD